MWESTLSAAAHASSLNVMAAIPGGAAIHFCAWDDVPQCRSDENRRHGGYPRSISRRTGTKQARSKRVYTDAHP